MGDEGVAHGEVSRSSTTCPSRTPSETGARTATEQMREIFKEQVEDGGLPDPQDPRTFEMAKLDWGELDQPRHREALDHFRHIWRRCAASSSGR